MDNSDSKKQLSICISTYEMRGLGHIFLKNNFDIFIKQTLKDFDVVVSDNSQDDLIKKLCESYNDRLVIHYYKNDDPLRGMSSNINNAIRKSTGKIIKILFLDDFLFNERSLETIVDNFNLKTDYWLVTGCEHTKDSKTFTRPHYPKYSQNIHLGSNTIGSPSVLAIKNEDPLLFDTKLKWLMDCDYYKRCYAAFGNPKILNAITVAIRQGEHQATNTEATNKLRFQEYQYILKKYECGLRYWSLRTRSFLYYPLSKIKTALLSYSS